MMTRCRVFGPIAIGGHPDWVEIANTRQQRLLAALILADGFGLDHDQLAERVWDDEDRPDDPAPSLRTYVNRLRVQLKEVGSEETVLTRPGGYRLDRSSFDVDLDRFEAELDSAAAAETSELQLEALTRGLALWQGEPFDSINDLDWVRPVAARLYDRRLDAIEQSLELRSELGHHNDAAAEAARVLEQHPYREGLRRIQMTALYRAGRQAEALAAFETHRRMMVEELGVEASPQLRRLESLILNQDSTLDAVGSLGRPQRGYRMHDQVGAGAFSTVYRARQPSVDRDVAIKVIRQELANRPEFIRRFDLEAQLVARLEHPHIVPLYDYWREPDRAYLVMRFFPDGSMARSLLDGPWTVDRVVRVAHQIGSALDLAHRRGVVHRDIKPANVLLDVDGNAFLSDFGIAVAVEALDEPGAGPRLGSPAYAAPEQIRREPVGPAADVYALGVVFYEALTGELPWADLDPQSFLQRQFEEPLPSLRLRRPDLRSDVDDVIRHATAKSADERYSSVSELVAAFLDAVGASEVSAIPESAGTQLVGPTATNPYRGLAPFEEADGDVFFGRDEFVDELLARMRPDRPSSQFLALVGPSGSGKSSVVNAGLVPRLRAGAVAGSDEWFIARMTPGTDPMRSLVDALGAVSPIQQSVLSRHLETDARGLRRCAREIVGREALSGGLLLIVDQLEELFTMGTPRSEIARFLDRITDAVSDPLSGVFVIVTLRADYFDRPLSYSGFADVVRHGTIAVGPLRADEVERAIVGPANSVGVGVEPGLVATIVADVANRIAALPLFEYALTELFDHRDGALTLDRYHELGGVAGALANRAEAFYTAASAERQSGIRTLFGQLVGVEAPTWSDATGAVIRRRVVVDDLVDRPGIDDSLLQEAAAARLVIFDRERSSREPTVEVSHEALLSEWPRLTDWIETDRRWLIRHHSLADAAQRWLDEGEEAAGLLRGGRLESAEELAAARPEMLTTNELRFVEAGMTQRDTEAEEAADQLARERRSARRFQRALIGVAAVAVVALVAGVVAVRQQQRADDERLVAQARRIEAEHAALVNRSLVEAEQQPDVALRLAIEAYGRDDGPPSQRALLAALRNLGPRRDLIDIGRHELPISPICRVEDLAPGVFASVGGEFGAGGELVIADVNKMEVERIQVPFVCGVVALGGGAYGGQVVQEDGPPRYAVVDPTGNLVEAPSELRFVEELGDGRALARLNAPDRPHESALVVVDSASYEIIEETTIPVSGVKVSPDKTMALANLFRESPDGDIETWTLVDLADFSTVEMGQAADGPIFWTPDSAELVHFGYDGITTRYDRTGAPLAEMPFPFVGDNYQFSFSEDGRHVLISSSEGAQLYAYPDLEPVGALLSVRQPIAGTSLLEDGSIAVLGHDGLIEVVGVEDQTPLSRVVPSGSNQSAFVISPEWGEIWEIDGSSTLINLDTGEQALDSLTGSDGDVRIPMFGLPAWDRLDGGYIAIFENGQEVRRSEGPLIPPTSRVETVMPDGQAGVVYFVVATEFVEGGPPSEVMTINIDLDSLTAVTHQPIAVSGWNGPPTATTAGWFAFVGETASFWNWEGEPLAPDLVLESPNAPLTLDPGGTLAVVVDPLGSLLVHDLASGVQVQRIEADSHAERPVLTADGRAVVRDRDGAVVLWDLLSGVEIGQIDSVPEWPPFNGATAGYTPLLDPNGPSLVYSRIGAFVEFRLDPRQWFETACELARPPLTPVEWVRYVPGDSDPADACAA